MKKNMDQKGQNNNNFDMTMHRYDGVKVCKLIGTYIINKLPNIINKKDMGLYKDDGLLNLRNCNGMVRDIIRKEIIKTFKIQLKI